jgi:transposase InsO family protein
MSAIMDLFNRQIMSYTLSRRNTTATALNPILALASSYNLQGTLVHCDRGPAYRSEAYQALLRNHGRQLLGQCAHGVFLWTYEM